MLPIIFFAVFTLNLLHGLKRVWSSLTKIVDLGAGLVGERRLGDLRDHVGVSVPKVTVVVLNHLY